MRVKNVALVLAASVLFASQAGADPVAKSGAYKIDPRHTQIVFTIQHMSLSHFFGRFDRSSGTMQFDGDAPEKSSLKVQIDTSSIDTHVPDLDGELKDLFKTGKFPTASFVSTRIVRIGATKGLVTGNLTIDGITRPVTLNVTFDGGRYPSIPFQAYRLGFDATGTIKRSDFGLNGTIWSGMVSDEVSLQIECELERQ